MNHDTFNKFELTIQQAIIDAVDAGLTAEQINRSLCKHAGVDYFPEREIEQQRRIIDALDMSVGYREYNDFNQGDLIFVDPATMGVPEGYVGRIIAPPGSYPTEAGELRNVAHTVENLLTGEYADVKLIDLGNPAYMEPITINGVMVYDADDEQVRKALAS